MKLISLDITFTLKSGTYCPYKKSNDKLFYMYTLSNHHPYMKRKLPLSINKRICSNSSNEFVCESAELEHQVALSKSCIRAETCIIS